MLLRKTGWEVEKNLSRLAADWRDRVGQVILELRQQTEVAAHAELESLESMLTQSVSDAPRVRRQIEELEALAAGR